MSPWLAGKLCEPMDAPRPQIERVSDVKALRDQTVVEDESKTRYKWALFQASGLGRRYWDHL